MGDVDIFSSNMNNSQIIGVDGADVNARGTNGVDATGIDWTDGTTVTDGTNGTRGTDGADGFNRRGVDANVTEGF